MLVTGKDVIDEFVRAHSGSKNGFVRWVQFTESAKWSSLVDVRKVFNTADYVAPSTVFNIKGNRYRLITVIDYSLGLVAATHALTHAEYDEGKWK